MRSAAPLRRRESRQKTIQVRESIGNAFITLTTDYGTNTIWSARSKASSFKINPDVTIVDITHNVTPFDLLDGALTIGSAYSYFPPENGPLGGCGSRVGTERRPLLVSAQNQYFVAPDKRRPVVIYEREKKT